MDFGGILGSFRRPVGTLFGTIGGLMGSLLGFFRVLFTGMILG